MVAGATAPPERGPLEHAAMEAAAVIETQQAEIDALHTLTSKAGEALAVMIRLGAPPDMVEFVHWQLDHHALFTTLKDARRS